MVPTLTPLCTIRMLMYFFGDVFMIYKKDNIKLLEKDSHLINAMKVIAEIHLLRRMVFFDILIILFNIYSMDASWK